MKKKIFLISLIVNIVFIFFVLRHFISAPKTNAVKDPGYFTNRNIVLNALPKDTCDVIFFGDSQVQNFEVSELFNSLKVKNRGICFDTSYGLLKRSDDIIEGKPAKIFIEIGVNDLLEKVSCDTICKNITDIVLRFKKGSPQTAIYIQSIFPISVNKSNRFAEIEKQRLSLNLLYKSLADKLNVHYINLESHFAGQISLNKYIGPDGVHLNGAGYKLWRNILLAYIN